MDTTMQDQQSWAALQEFYRQVEQDHRDAERYRKLKDYTNHATSEEWDKFTHRNTDFDAAVDALPEPEKR